MTKEELWHKYEQEKMVKEKLAEELSWLRDEVIPKLRAELAKKDEAIKHAIEVVKES